METWIAHYFNNLFEKFIHMRIVEDKDGERFLVIESDEDFEKFKEDLLKTAREKAKDRARKPSYETQSPKWKLYNFSDQRYKVSLCPP